MTTERNDPIESYLAKSHQLVEAVAGQAEQIRNAAKMFAGTIADGRMVHLFGSGHSRIMVEEMWPRYGSFPGFNPMVELSLTFHNPVVGSNGQRQAMYLENVSGFADRILRNYDIRPGDAGLVVSSGGCNVVPIEMAECLKQRGVSVVALVSRAHAEASVSKHPRGHKLHDVAAIVLDTGAPVGDAMVEIDDLDTPVAPGSTVGGCVVINCLKAAVADELVQLGHAPTVLTASVLVGAERSAELFESAYDEHGRRLGQLLAVPKAKAVE